MSINAQLLSSSNLVIVTHVGIDSDEEFLAFYRSLYEDERFHPTMDHLIDLRQVNSVQRSPDAMQELARYAQGQLRGRLQQPRVAVVAPDDLPFGLARMCEMFGENVPWEFRVFREINAARDWLGIADAVEEDLDEIAIFPVPREGAAVDGREERMRTKKD